MVVLALVCINTAQFLNEEHSRAKQSSQKYRFNSVPKMGLKLIYSVLFVLTYTFECGYSEVTTINFKPWTHEVGTVFYSAATNYTGDKGIRLNPDKTFDSDEIILVHSQISSFPRNVFEVFTNVTKVNMRECGIRSLRRSDFVGGTNVTRLDLADNMIGQLPSEAFIHLKSLKFLYISGNPITTLSADTFAGLAELEQLWMQKMLLNGIPTDLFKPLAKVEFLVLGSNNISEFPEDIFSNNFKLERLNINNCSTKFLHPMALAHQNMWWLGINDNAFESPVYLPPTRYVDAKNSNIKDLYLNGTCLKLDAQNNHLTKIVSNDLSEMMQLRLENNLITDISFLKNMGSLRELGLSENPIPQASLTKEFFDDKTDLRFLYLSKMNLTDLSPGIFDSLTEMWRMDLSYNQFAQLSIDYFKPLKRLSELDLRGNPLEEFDVDGLNVVGVKPHILGTIDEKYRYCRFVLEALTYPPEVCEYLRIKIDPEEVELCENLLKKSSQNKEMVNHISKIVDQP